MNKITCEPNNHSYIPTKWISYPDDIRAIQIATQLTCQKCKHQINKDLEPKK